MILVLSVIVSVSALPSWLTGKATGTDSVSIKVNKGETKSFSLGGETHEISLVFMDDASVVVLSVDGANTGGIVKGATYESGNLKVKVLTIRYSNNWFSKSKYVTLEVSRVESEISLQYLLVYDDSPGQSALDIVLLGDLQVWLQKQSNVELGDLLIKNSEVTKSMLSNKISVFVSDRKAEVILGEQIYGDSETNVFRSKAKHIRDYLFDRTPTSLKGVCSNIINSNVKTDDLRNYFCEGSAFISKTDESTIPTTEVTYAGVLAMLSKCSRTALVVDTSDSYWDTTAQPTGNSLCNNEGKKCVMTLITKVTTAPSSAPNEWGENTDAGLWACNQDATSVYGRSSWQSYRMDAICCSP